VFLVSQPRARPDVIYDGLTVTKPTYGVTWAGHASARPDQTGSVLKFGVGRSMATLTTLVPASAKAVLLKEPTLKTDELYMKNDPAEGISSTRFEVTSPKGTLERRFLSAIVVSGASDPAPAAVKVEGEGCEGTAIDREAYEFTIAGLSRLPSPSPTPLHPKRRSI
jgi:hypothetical protein